MRRRAVISLAAVAVVALLACASAPIVRGRARSESLRSGEAAYTSGDYQAAYRRAMGHLRRFPDDRLALLIAARSLSRSNLVARAELLFLKAGRPLGPEDWHARAEGLLNAGRSAEAADAYLEVLDLVPEDVLALRRLAALEIARDNVREASRLADRLTRIESGAVVGHTMKGVIAYNGGVPEESVAAFERVLELDPKLLEMPLKPPQMFWGYLAHDLLSLGRSDDARRHLERALDEHPRDAGFMDLLARTYEHEGDLDEAARCWQRAAEWDPDLASPWLNLGRLALLDGDPGRAIELLGHASNLAPDAPEPYYSLSLAHRRLGHADQAECYRRKADRLKDPAATSP